MANDLHTSTDPGFSDLMHGIIQDLGELIRHEIRFARTEIKTDLAKAKEATTYLCLGSTLMTLGIGLLALMGVFLLHWLTAPTGSDPGSIPLWGCFAIVAALFFAVGAAVFGLGYQKFKTVNALPVQTAQSVKENVEWIVNSK